METPREGSHIVSQRFGYEHHGIYIGDGRVVHYYGFGNSVSDGCIRESSLKEFCGGKDYTLIEHPNGKYSPTEIIKRAKSKLREERCPSFINSEHFVGWCIYGNQYKPNYQQKPAETEPVIGCDTLPPVGSHLKSDRIIYSHHGLYVGDGKVIHYTGFANGISKGRIRETSLEEFCAGNGYRIVPHPNRKYSPVASVKRAKSRLGENCYHLFANNCEHFVNWCIEGDYSSKQVDVGTSLFSGSFGGAVSAASRVTIATSGTIAGLSGSGIMSGLASVGSLVGGGVVAGLGVIGGSGGLAAASILNTTVLKDIEELDDEERKARAVGRKATYVGAAAGTASSIAAVSSLGSVSGLSAAGITSGLSAIGGCVGGSMSAGVGLTVAAPVVAATAFGYGLYKAVKWFKK